MLGPVNQTPAMDQNQHDLFIKTVLSNWELVVKRASKFFDACSDEELLTPIVPGKNRVVYPLGHLTAAVTAEDFAREPHRNKLNIVLNRTGHVSYHLGQLVLLKK